MKTWSSHYYLQRGFVLLIGILFSTGFVYDLLFPDSFSNTNSEASPPLLLPMFLFGSVGLFLSFWMAKNYFRVQLDDLGITKLSAKANEPIAWEDIESIKSIEWLWKGMLFKVKPNNQKAFFFFADKPPMGISSNFGNEFKSKMDEFIQAKKQELGI